MECSIELLALALFACEVFLSLGAAIVVALVPSVLGGCCATLLFACGLLGVISAQTINDLFALLRVACALMLSVTIMFFVVPNVEEIANALIDAVLVPRLAVDVDSEAAKELRQTLHFGEDALLCVFVAMVCAGWILFSTVWWTHVRHGRVAERALRRFLKATPAIPYFGGAVSQIAAMPRPLAEPLLGGSAMAGATSGAMSLAAPSPSACSMVGELRRGALVGAAVGGAHAMDSAADAPAGPPDGVGSRAQQQQRGRLDIGRTGTPVEQAAAAAPAARGVALAGGSGVCDSCGVARGMDDAAAPRASEGRDTASQPAAAPRVAAFVGAEEAGEEAECCAICLCAFERGEPVRVLACRHPFHKECIDRWVLSMQLAADCPLCKRALLEDFI